MDINFFGLSPLEILLIMVVAVMVFGPDKLPTFARTAGKYVNEFRRMSQEVRTQVSRELTIDLKDEEGKSVGLEQYFVQVRDEVKGAFSDVTKSIATETAAVKSALTLDPKLLQNVTSDTITTTIVTNPDTPQAETVLSQVTPTSSASGVNLPAFFTADSNIETKALQAPTTINPSRIHTLTLDAYTPATSTESEHNNAAETLTDGTSFSEYERTFGAYEMVDIGLDSGKSTVKPRISKRGGYAGSRSRK